MTKALLVIDLQNDYFPGGKFPLWNTEAVLQNIERAIERANAQGIPVVIIQHVAKQGLAPFFNEGTPGAEIHPRILAVAPKAPIVVKEFADSFERTNLEETLTKLDATELLVCGMMTQNCVTHTAISKAAAKYSVAILVDCCTTSADAERIAEHLNMTPDAFAKAHLATDEEGDRKFRQQPCPFLGGDDRCRIYSVRPTDCREYPFTNKEGFVFRTMGHANRALACPAVFWIVEEMRSRSMSQATKRRRRRRK